MSDEFVLVPHHESDIRVPREEIVRLCGFLSGLGYSDAQKHWDAMLAAPPAAQPTGELAKVIAEMRYASHVASSNGHDDIYAGYVNNWRQRLEAIDTQTAQPDSAQEALAAFIANPQPVMPVEGKVTEEMVDRALAEFLDWSFEGWHASMKKAGGDAELNDAMRAALEAALGQPVGAQGGKKE